LILLRWLLEFRVGHSADRHGYLFGLEWLKRFPKLAWTFWGGFLLLITVLFWRNSAQVDWLFELGVMLLLMGALLAWFWRSIGLALLNVVANTLALLASVLLVAQLWPQFEIILLLVLVPLGLIVDDGIHFFSRYRRAQQEVFRSGDEAVRYAMASVARPIWMTTWITFAGLSVLLLSSEPRVQQAAAITLLGLLVASFVVLFMVPWWLLIQARFRSGSGSDPAEKRRVTRS
jgi:multidrug efflux pump subunit AcrB